MNRLASLSAPSLSPVLAAATGPSPISFTEALLLLAVAALLVTTYQLRRVAHRLSALEPRLGAAPAPAAPASRAIERPLAAPLTGAAQDTPPEIQAILAAAVFAALGDSARVVAITEGIDSTQVWSLEGRRQIFASHQIR